MSIKQKKNRFFFILCRNRFIVPRCSSKVTFKEYWYFFKKRPFALGIHPMSRVYKHTQNGHNKHPGTKQQFVGHIKCWSM